MNRVIKFRAWDSKDKKFWDKFEMYSDGGKIVGVNHAYKNIHVMQFTGLHDKDGKEIYESDLLEARGVTFRCDWNTKDGCWEFNFVDGYNPKASLDEMEVIGNIYENN